MYRLKPSGGLPLSGWNFAPAWGLVQSLLRAAKGSDPLESSITNEGLKAQPKGVGIGIGTAGFAGFLEKIGVDVEGLLHVFCFSTARMAVLGRLVWLLLGEVFGGGGGEVGGVGVVED
jgi:hypothetical protein